MAVSEGATLSGLVERLAEEVQGFAPYAAKSKDAGSYAPLRIMVNGRDVAPGQRERTVLAEGDDVLILLPIAGG